MIFPSTLITESTLWKHRESSNELYGVGLCVAPLPGKYMNNNKKFFTLNAVGDKVELVTTPTAIRRSCINKEKP